MPTPVTNELAYHCFCIKITCHSDCEMKANEFKISDIVHETRDTTEL